MPAKRPSGARNETVKCEFCGEDYAVTYKRCPFCEEDEPTRIFRKPQFESPTPPSARPARRQEDEPDEYEELLSRRPRKAVEDDEEYEPPRRRARRDVEEDDEPPRRRTRHEDEDDDYEPPRRRSRRDDYDDEDDDEDEPPRRRGHDGGKRLVTNERGGGYRRRGPSVPQIIGAVLSVALVAAAVYIVFLIVKPLFGKEDPTPPPTDSVVTVSPSPTVEPTIEPSDVVIPTGDPGVVVPPVESETPPPVVTTIPSGQTATGFTLANSAGKELQEFTLSNQYPTFTFNVVFSPAGSTGSITWSSSKPNIVSVDQNGKTAAVAQGVATITATMAGGYSKQCMVRSTIGGTPAAQPSTAPSASAPVISSAPSTAPSTAPSPSASAALAFNVSGADFTLSGVGDAWTLKVKNATGTPTWAVKDSSIATVDANGRVTAVAKGTTKVTATVDGQTLECTVRVTIP